jgi:DNA-binding PadR family transcriptional regulator
MRRGDIRVAVLNALVDGPAHGYDVMQRLEDKTNGSYRPSPGSVYPTLQLLQDEGLATVTEQDGKRVFSLTEEGKAVASRSAEAAGGLPWERPDQDGGERFALRETIKPLILAVRQVAEVGGPVQLEKAVAILKDARKQIYALLAED